MSHIIDCGMEDTMDPIDIDSVDEVDKLLESKLIMLSSRVNRFLDMVDC